MNVTFVPCGVAILWIAASPQAAPAAETIGDVRALLAQDRVASVAPGYAMQGELPPASEPPDIGHGASLFGGGDISPMRAFLYSALVPGLGQLAQGSATGYVYLGVEAVGWAGYIHYNQKGHDGEDEYRAFADANYSKAQYDSVLAEVYREYEGGYCLEAGSDTAFVCQELAGYFNLDSDTHSGHYYEDIGKLDKYIFGWLDWGDTTGDGRSDYDPSTSPVSWGVPWSPSDPWPAGLPPITSDLRAQYQDLRRSANHNFAKADNFSWLILLNHVVSGCHAAWMAHRRNETDTELGEAKRATHLVVDPPTLDGRLRVALARRF